MRRHRFFHGDALSHHACSRHRTAALAGVAPQAASLGQALLAARVVAGRERARIADPSAATLYQQATTPCPN